MFVCVVFNISLGRANLKALLLYLKLYISFYKIEKRCMVWYGMVRYGVVWYGMVWYGKVWYGMV